MYNWTRNSKNLIRRINPILFPFSDPSIQYYNGNVGSTEEGGYSRPYLRFGRSSPEGTTEASKEIDSDVEGMDGIYDVTFKEYGPARPILWRNAKSDPHSFSR